VTGASAHRVVTELTIRRILFATENGVSIFTAADQNGKSVRVLATSKAMSRPPGAGETWEVEGELRHHADYGYQLHAGRCTYKVPRGRLLVPFLACNPAFKGIGEVKAALLFEKFGDDLAPIIDAGNVERLNAVLTTEVAVSLVEAWRTRRMEAELIEYLDAHGFSPRLAVQLRRAWGDRARAMLDHNPYFMLAFASWRSVDAAARLTGISAEDERRLVGAVEAVLYEALQHGHTLTGHEQLERDVRKLLCNESSARALELAVADGAALGSVSSGYQAIGAAALERRISDRILTMLTGQHAIQGQLFGVDNRDLVIDRCLKDLETSQGFVFNAEQRAAVRLSASASFSLLMGGAGVGKTTVLRAVITVAQAQGVAVHQMALAGRAVKRLQQATGAPATTIARFLAAAKAGKLELSPDSLLVVDEASMLDLPTMYRLLRFLPDGARMLLAGDSAQLPPIGFGLVFHRLVDSRRIPRVELTQVHRQAASTGIPVFAGKIRRHLVPEVGDSFKVKSGISFVDRTVSQVIPTLFAIAAEWNGEDWCVLSAVKDGPSGTRSINERFHEANCRAQSFLEPTLRRLGNFTVGDPVVYLVNDYDKGLMNGALGVVKEVIHEPQDGLLVDFEGAEYVVPYDEVEERLDLAYAISVHKAQGSQFKRVAVVVTKTRILDHALIYTALTRAVEQVVFIGDRNAFENAVRRPPYAQMRRVAFNVGYSVA
jgi:exodeoxyribonuclease V alpha subunit